MSTEAPPVGTPNQWIPYRLQFCNNNKHDLYTTYRPLIVDLPTDPCPTEAPSVGTPDQWVPYMIGILFLKRV